MVEFGLRMLVAVVVSAATLLSCVLIEQVGLRQPISWRARLPGFAMNCTGTAATLLLAWPLTQLWGVLGVPTLITLPLWGWLKPLGWLGWGFHFLFLALLADFLAYWRHRVEHRVGWTIHAVHHSPRELHAANDIGHPLQVFYNIAFISIPLSLVGVDGPTMPLALTTLIGMLSIYIHSPVAVHAGPARRFIVDNRFHRIHHSIEERHFNKNFGICFSCWDHLFGTAYQPGEQEWPDVGLAGTPPPRTVGEYLLYPFKTPKEDAAEPHSERVRAPLQHTSAAGEGAGPAALT